MIYIRHGSVQAFNSRLPVNASERDTHGGREGGAMSILFVRIWLERGREGGREGRDGEREGEGGGEKEGRHTPRIQSLEVQCDSRLCAQTLKGEICSTHTCHTSEDEGNGRRGAPTSCLIMSQAGGRGWFDGQRDFT